MPDDWPLTVQLPLGPAVLPVPAHMLPARSSQRPIPETKIRPVNMVIAILLHCQGGKRKPRHNRNAMHTAMNL